MEEDDDDFYGGAGGKQEHEYTEYPPIKDEHMNGADDEDEEDEEDEEDDDDDDDVQFTLEKPEGIKAEPSRPVLKERVISDTKVVAKSSTPVKHEQTTQAGSTAAPVAIKGTLTYNGKEGKDFPEIRTSTIDLDAYPIWPGNGKPIIEMDIDADLAEHSKPWRITGTDQTDYFNYGFDEYTWTVYCIKQRDVRKQIDDQKHSEQQMKAVLGISDKGAPGGPPGMPPMPSGMPGMPGMPDMFSPEQMMQQMMAQGLNPANMDFNQFMQMAGQMGLGADGPVQNSASPAPGSGQGFQPPSAPSASQGQGGFPVNMEGYSPQQMAIMQDQQGPMGGGGGRGRGRRGRGYY